MASSTPCPLVHGQLSGLAVLGHAELGDRLLDAQRGETGGTAGAPALAHHPAQHPQSLWGTEGMGTDMGHRGDRQGWGQEQGTEGTDRVWGQEQGTERVWRKKWGTNRVCRGTKPARIQPQCVQGS